MKKILFILLTTMISLSLFISCDSSDDPPITDLGDIEITFKARHIKEGLDLDGTVYVYENVPLGKVGSVTFPNDKVGSFSLEGLTYYIIHEIEVKNGTGKITLSKTPRIKNYYFLFYSPSLGSPSTGSLLNGHWDADNKADYHEYKQINFNW